MAEYVFPALFHPNDDGSFTITYPDLPGCISEGKSLGNAMYMAQSALALWLECALEEKEPIPRASSLRDIPQEGSEFVSLIRADVRDKKAVRRNISIPQWMDEKATQYGLSLSRVLQDALREKFAE